jgi:hypothetical protein
MRLPGSVHTAAVSGPGWALMTGLGLDLGTEIGQGELEPPSGIINEPRLNSGFAAGLQGRGHVHLGMGCLSRVWGDFQTQADLLDRTEYRVDFVFGIGVPICRDWTINASDSILSKLKRTAASRSRCR